MGGFQPRGMSPAQLLEAHRALWREAFSLKYFRTPDVVEFAVSPQVGQAVLACPQSYSSSDPKFSAGGQASTACPTSEVPHFKRHIDASPIGSSYPL
jgi:hypothetical protein